MVANGTVKRPMAIAAQRNPVQVRVPKLGRNGCRDDVMCGKVLFRATKGTGLMVSGQHHGSPLAIVRGLPPSLRLW